MNATTYRLDIAKSVFQLYWVDPGSGEVFNRRFSRDQLIRFLSNREPGRVALEACSGAHWWARKIVSLGHQAILLHAKYVRPFVQTNKTDAADARAIWTAAQQPGMRTVAIKSEAQQAILSLHRIRSALVDTRTRQVNQIRGLLGEYGLHFRYGRKALMNTNCAHASPRLSRPCRRSSGAPCSARWHTYGNWRRTSPRPSAKTSTG